MKRNIWLMAALLSLASMKAVAQQPVVHFDMSLTQDGKITESVTKNAFVVTSQLPAFAVKSIDGDALRFDGYSNYVQTGISSSSLSTTALTLTVTLAAESYPMMKVDVAEDTPSYACIFGNLDENNNTGIALELSSQGDLQLRFASSDGFIYGIKGNKKLVRGQWNQVTAVLNKSGNSAKLYLNGEEIGTGRMNRKDIAHSTSNFFIGKSAEEKKEGLFHINTFCGLIDDIAIYNEAQTPSAFSSAETPDFNYPASRYEASLWRPQFHGMPSGSWSNETHGMTFADGRYHVFFQKNANGPYMSRLHWGHISSENLYDWREELIAIAPGESYDIKGCWSGCVFDNNGTPNILYTGVDNAKARIVQASPADQSLVKWNKQGVVIDGTPAGGFQDFRDPYYFEANGQKYIIVGTGKNGVGCCTLHKQNGTSWSNDGAIFFQGTSAAQHGTFWEMPNVTPMGDGRFLFTCTPLGTSQGVRTLCWVGTIGSDGKFTADGNGIQYLEMGGISRDGYGLLSPTIYQKDGKTLLLGIVPDKLPTRDNYEMGWAHNYSLPREISLAADGTLVQKPYSGLTGMRTDNSYTHNGKLIGTQSLAPVSGRQLELLGRFTVTSGEMGFRFLKSGSRQASLTYNADNGMLTLDLTQLDRTANDNDSYKGTYSASLPKKPANGETLTLHVYLDGSIADIFVNDTWAFSVRLFPTNASQVEAEVFATAETQADVQAWTLDATNGTGTGIFMTPVTGNEVSKAVYNLQGIRQSTVPQSGIFIQNGRKYVAR